VTVYNRTRTKVEALVALGPKAAAGVSDACRGDAVITMLANDDAVERVVFGDGGIGAAHPAGSLVVGSLGKQRQRLSGQDPATDRDSGERGGVRHLPAGQHDLS
jgi:hypothetical protein